MSTEEELSDLSRAEDILLGAMGYSDDAKLEKVKILGEQIFLNGAFRSDGESFSVKFDCERGKLEDWALEILRKVGKVE